MKRYQLFGFDNYYPSGGLNDVRAEGDTLPELLAEYAAKWARNGDWWRNDAYQILDLESRCMLPDAEVERLLQSVPSAA